MSILGDQYDTAIKGFEGFAPRASWDYKQNSVGWGTRARAPNETIDPAEAQRRYDEEIAKAHGIVKSFAPNVDHGTAAALTSLTFNAGDDWTRSGLGNAIKTGDLDRARASFLQYVNAGGQPLDGLRKRRAAEVAWIGSGGQPDQTGQAPMAMRPRGTRWDEALPQEGGEPWDEASRTGIMPPQPMQPPSVAGYQARSAPAVAMQPQQQEQPGFLDQIVARAQNPLFQQGLGMFLAASQGKDLNAGLSAGTDRATAMQGVMMKNLAMKREMAQREAMQKLIANSQNFVGVPPAIMDVVRVTGDVTPAVNFMAKHPEIELEREKARLQSDDLTERVASRRAESDYKSRSLPLQERKLQAEVDALSTGKVKDTAGFRRQQIIDAGLDPDDERNKVFIGTGKMPREDQQPLTVTDKKAILEADEAVENAQSIIGNLDRAIELSGKAYVGPTAGIRGYATSLFGSEEGKATEDLNNVVTTNALQSLKAIFGGNPTEGERKILLDIQGSATKAPEVREDIFRRAKGMAQRRLEFNKKRADELRGGTFYKSGGSKAPAAPTPGRLKFNPETGELE